MNVSSFSLSIPILKPFQYQCIYKLQYSLKDAIANNLFDIFKNKNKGIRICCSKLNLMPS